MTELNTAQTTEYPIALNMPSFERADEVYGLRYTFQPGSIDDTLPATLTRDGTEFTVEAPGIQNNESFFFSGQKTDAKDVECVLEYDPETESFVLHKLTGVVRLNPMRSAPAARSRTATGSSQGDDRPPKLVLPPTSTATASSTPAVAAKTSPRAYSKPPAPVRNPSVIELPSFDRPEGAPAASASSDEDMSSDDDQPQPIAQPTSQPARKPISLARLQQQSARSPAAPARSSGLVLPPSRTAARPPPQSDGSGSDGSGSDEDDISDEDDDKPPAPVPTRAPVRAPARVPPPATRSPAVGGPISLRGYAGQYRRDEEELSSSSEEE
ncbi:uncharacterized protein V1510DRAFT_417361 [Dipodascopsis tothii]|uniref:uncharacterized protein n=1 Tax=Dipodascopsis tothii TaxID=44089 RepID=UPI0034CD7518